MDLWLLRRQLLLLTPHTTTPTDSTADMQMLRCAATKAATLVCQGYDVSAFESCEEC